MGKLGIRMSICLILGLSIPAYAMPPVESDLTISGVVVTEPNGDSAVNLAEPVSLTISAAPGGGVCLSPQQTLETGPTTNSFLLEYDLVGCEGVILSSLGSTAQFDMFLDGVLNSSLEVSTQVGHFVELLQFTRNSPISLILENLGFPVPSGADLRLTPRVLDSEGNVLFQGADVVASPDGTGPIEGGAMFSFILDAIPEDVILQNVDRQLSLELAAVEGGVVQGQIAQLTPFQLTYRTSSGCMELLQFGPGNQTVLPPVLASVGCGILAPPPSCLDESSQAIAAARDYKRTTRIVRRKCGRKLTTTCQEALVSQANAYQAVTEAQAQVELACVP